MRSPPATCKAVRICLSGERLGSGGKVSSGGLKRKTASAGLTVF